MIGQGKIFEDSFFIMNSFIFTVLSFSKKIFKQVVLV